MTEVRIYSTTERERSSTGKQPFQLVERMLSSRGTHTIVTTHIPLLLYSPHRLDAETKPKKLNSPRSTQHRPPCIYRIFEDSVTTQRIHNSL